MSLDALRGFDMFWILGGDFVVTTAGKMSGGNEQTWTLFGWLAINPLPLLMAGTMFLQMKITPQSGDPAQRKMMMFMPLIFIFMCYNFASALALYWTVQNIISIVQLRLNRDKNAAQPVTVIAK